MLRPARWPKKWNGLSHKPAFSGSINAGDHIMWILYVRQRADSPASPLCYQAARPRSPVGERVCSSLALPRSSSPATSSTLEPDRGRNSPVVTAPTVQPATLITPNWPSAPWYPRLLALSSEPPLLLPGDAADAHLLVSHTTLLAWRLEPPNAPDLPSLHAQRHD